MESITIPRLPMPGFETKPFNPKLAQCRPHILNLIKLHYEENPNDFLDDIQRLRKLRKRAAQLHKNVDGLAILKRYFCQLRFLQKKFPSLEDHSPPPSSDETWKELLSASSAAKTYFRTEFTTTLYNIAALHTQLGAESDRTTEAGLKAACNHFECAAWAFEYLCDVTSVNAGSDFSRGYFEFVVSTCLAQAQECIVEENVSKMQEPLAVARIVAQVGEYYLGARDGLTRHLQEDTIFANSGVKRGQVNLAYAEFKLCYFRAFKNFFLGIQAEEDKKMGDRVAFFKLALEEFEAAIQLTTKTTEYPFNKVSGVDMSLLQNMMEKKFKSVSDENNTVYFQVVPFEHELPQIEGMPLAKCVDFDADDLKISGPDFFSKLVQKKSFVKTNSQDDELLECVNLLVREEEVIEELPGVYEVEYTTSYDADVLSSDVVVEEQYSRISNSVSSTELNYSLDIPDHHIVGVQNTPNATFIICQSGHRHSASSQSSLTVEDSCSN